MSEPSALLALPRAPRKQAAQTRPPLRVLFVGEGVTLAHVVRPLQLARQVRRHGIEPIVAFDPACARFVDAGGLRHAAIRSVDPKVFLERVYRAKPLFTLGELRAAVHEDLALIDSLRPDVVVGDFRLSLGIATERRGVPHLALSNAHWSPRAKLPVPVPEHPFVRLLGVAAMRQVLRFALPFYFARQMKALNRVRREHGLARLEGGAHEAFTHGTRTLYLDIPELYPIGRLSDREAFIGPVHWEPDGSLPAWWEYLPDGPAAFVTPGSSGDLASVRTLVETLAGLGLTVMLAGAGRLPTSGWPHGVYAADFIPADAAVRRARLVACNGGSPMVYHALRRGVPVLGLPVNLDQHYVMQAVEQAGAGRTVRPGSLARCDVLRAAHELLGDPACHKSARGLQRRIATWDPAWELASHLRELVALPKE